AAGDGGRDQGVCAAIRPQAERLHAAFSGEPTSFRPSRGRQGGARASRCFGNEGAASFARGPDSGGPSQGGGSGPFRGQARHVIHLASNRSVVAGALASHHKVQSWFT